MKFHTFIKAIAAVSAWSLVAIAHAGTVHIQFDNPIFNGSGYDNVTINYLTATNQAASATVSAGRFQGTASNIVGDSPSIFVDGLNDVFMYCYDLYEHISSGQNVDYTINHSGPTARTLNFLGAVNYVLNGNSNTWTDPYAWAHPISGEQGAAIQLGIWESKYDTSNTWSLLPSAGSTFSATGLETATNNWWLAFAAAASNASVKDLPAALVMTLEAPGAQDMITPDPPQNVPEPLSLALFGIGLAGLAAARRKLSR